MSNVGTADRIVRILVAIVLFALGWGGLVGGTVGTILKFAGFVPLATAAIGFCPLYLPFGISTRGKA